MRRTRLLLVSPPAPYDVRQWAAPIPCKPQLHSLAGFVRDVADARIVELDVTMGSPGSFEGVPAFLERIDAFLSLGDVDLVGISCWTSFHYLGAVAVIRAVRRRAPRVPIVVGGHHATAVPADFTQSELGVDFVVRGDGEHALRSLCEARPRRPASAKVVEGRRYVLEDPGKIDWASYPWQNETNRTLWLSLSRGCPFDCVFCVGRARISAYGVAEALDVLERLCRERAPHMICLADPVFGLDHAWTEALLDGIVARGLETRFWAETRVDVVRPPLLDRLRAAGFWLDFGLDTASPDMVRTMGKSGNPARYLARAQETLRHADAIDLPHLLYLLFNHPGETPATAAETVRFVEELAAGPGPLSGMAAGQSFFFLPGTDAYRRLAAHERRWGTKVRHPTWWREPADQYRLATEVLPSAAFGGREQELSHWATWQHQLNHRWAPRRTAYFDTYFRRLFG